MDCRIVLICLRPIVKLSTPETHCFTGALAGATKDRLLSNCWHIDTDIAFGSGAGDPDDGFALGYALASGLGVTSVSSVFGNTSSQKAAQCARELLDRLGAGAGIPVFKGASSWGELAPDLPSTFSGSHDFHILALGPLTNIAHWLLGSRRDCIRSITVVGSDPACSGRLPPIYPFEFNLTKDRWATKTVFRSPVPLNVVPLNMARRLFLDDSILERLLHESMTPAFHSEARRWLHRSKRWGKPTVPVWDLVAAFWARHPDLCKAETRIVTTSCFGQVLYLSKAEVGQTPGTRPVKEVSVLSDFSPSQVWDYFVDSLRSHGVGLLAHARR